MSRRNKSLGRFLGSSVGIVLAIVSQALPASAHISLELGGTHMSRYGDGELKAGPCGRAGGTKGTHIYTYAPGQKITVTVVETIVHPSYFRFAFDNDGDDAFIEPASIMPIDPARKCPDGPGDHCGASDFYNSPAVLPNMDNLNPHITAAANTKYTWEVTLPNVECTNCTLQIIQVMEDDLAHGPYDPTPGVGVEDIYHQCIDIVLSPGDGGTGGSSDAGTAGDGRITPTTDARVNDTGAAGASIDAGRTPDANTGTGGSAGRGGSTGIDGSTPPTIDAAGGSGGSGGTGAGGSTGGTAGSGPGSAGKGGSAGSAGSAGASAGTGPGGDDNGCSCTVVGARGSAGALAGWSLLALALASRRRRR